jgi:hypothetical protein
MPLPGREPSPVAAACSAAFCAAVLLWAIGALAQGTAPSPAAHEQAIASFEAARAFIKNGDCTSAIPKLKEALTYEPLVGAHLNLAECYVHTDPLAAWREFKEAEFLTYARGDDRTKIAHDRAAALEPQLALLRFVMAPDVLQTPGLEVKLDGIPIDRFYYQSGVIAVDPGTHPIEARTPGKRFSATTTATAGATSQVDVVLTDAPPELPPSVPPPRMVFGASPGRRTAALVTGSVGLASVVLGAVTGVVSLYYANDAKTECEASPSSLSKCTSHGAKLDGNTANRFAVVSDVGLFGGGALVVAGAVLYFTAPVVPLGGPTPAERPSASDHGSAPRFLLVPAIGPVGASCFAVGSF